MSDLEMAFYIIGIVFMSLMLILLIALVIAVFVIRAKVIAIQRQIEEKIDTVTSIASRSGEIVAKVGARAASRAAGKLKKASRKLR
jgi:hypothetical protein